MSESIPQFLGSLATSDQQKRTERTQRRKTFKEESFPPDQQPVLENKGWEFIRQNKSTVRMRIPKPTIGILANRFWNILYNFGYAELNQGTDFRIRIDPGEGASAFHNIEVFGKDAETVVITKCIRSDIPKQKSKMKDLDNLKKVQGSLSKTVRKHYGQSFKPKILWFIVSEGISWSEDHKSIASQNNIHIITSRELLYFEEISKKLGKAARFQFHAEYLEKQKVPEFSGRKVPAVKTKIGGKTAYFFSARPLDILRISFVNHRDLRDPMGTPSYQRLVTPSRLKEIGSFLNEGGFFPNTILLNFKRSPTFNYKNKDPISNVQFGELVLPDRYKSCWVIDGQHRLYGTTFANESVLQAPLFFVAFDKMDPIEEANTFATINTKQTRVPQKLLAELDGDIKWDSDNQKERLAAIASRTVDLLNSSSISPFEGKVVPPGATAATGQPLTLPNCQQAILKSKLLGAVDPQTKNLIPGPSWVASSEQSSEKSMFRLFELLEKYFSALSSKNIERWQADKSGYLCHNFGFFGHVRLLGELISHIECKENYNASEQSIDELIDLIFNYVAPIFEFVSSADDEAFSRKFKVAFGSGGSTEYFYKLVAMINENDPTFAPDGFEKYIQTISDEETQNADRDVKWVQKNVPAYAIGILKKEFGPHFFDEIISPKIQLSCQSKRIEDKTTQKSPPETYLDWIDFFHIAKDQNTKKKLDIPLSIKLPTDKKTGGQRYLNWFNKFNEIRRISAHPAGRKYRSADIEFLKFILPILKDRIET